MTFNHSPGLNEINYFVNKITRRLFSLVRDQTVAVVTGRMLQADVWLHWWRIDVQCLKSTWKCRAKDGSDVAPLTLPTASREDKKVYPDLSCKPAL